MEDVVFSFQLSEFQSEAVKNDQIDENISQMTCGILKEMKEESRSKEILNQNRDNILKMTSELKTLEDNTKALNRKMMNQVKLVGDDCGMQRAFLSDCTSLMRELEALISSADADLENRWKEEIISLQKKLDSISLQSDKVKKETDEMITSIVEKEKRIQDMKEKCQQDQSTAENYIRKTKELKVREAALQKNGKTLDDRIAESIKENEVMKKKKDELDLELNETRERAKALQNSKPDDSQLEHIIEETKKIKLETTSISKETQGIEMKLFSLWTESFQNQSTKAMTASELKQSSEKLTTIQSFEKKCYEQDQEWELKLQTERNEVEKEKKKMEFLKEQKNSSFINEYETKITKADTELMMLDQQIHQVSQELKEKKHKHEKMKELVNEKRKCFGDIMSSKVIPVQKCALYHYNKRIDLSADIVGGFKKEAKVQTEINNNVRKKIHKLEEEMGTLEQEKCKINIRMQHLASTLTEKNKLLDEKKNQLKKVTKAADDAVEKTRELNQKEEEMKAQIEELSKQRLLKLKEIEEKEEKTIRYMTELSEEDKRLKAPLEQEYKDVLNKFNEERLQLEAELNEMKSAISTKEEQLETLTGK